MIHLLLLVLEFLYISSRYSPKVQYGRRQLRLIEPPQNHVKDSRKMRILEKQALSSLYYMENNYIPEESMSRFPSNTSERIFRTRFHHSGAETGQHHTTTKQISRKRHCHLLATPHALVFLHV